MKSNRTIVSVFLLQLVVLIQTVPLQSQTVAKCISDISDSSRTKVCDLRHYRPARGVDADRFVKCALSAIGFVADDGSVQRKVVLSALDEVESHDESAGNFQDALELRELKTASQWPEHQAFDRTKVQQQMLEVNRQLQCK
ncbi:uncharacterized protein LOC126570063 [Anopheles aquasalis]|uniref:uncharacterized protein LOC126570063 n=1 Tax=Anopheles aquasalis TaxID=42839 RepID=UPI00215A11C2|nr:uncharacterized protein LOC126570063 [Anopheles aquasalis]